MPLIKHANFTLEIKPYTKEDLIVKEFTGKEAISELFCFTVDVATTKKEVDFDKIIGKPALLTILRDKSKERLVHGITSKCEFVFEEKEFLHYRFEIVPYVWLLKYQVNSRIFQEKSVKDIIKDVFEKAGITSDKYKISLQGNYQPREYCVQYQESDFDFISRLMEEEGIFYFFQHEKNNHVMIIADAKTIHKAVDAEANIKFRDSSGLAPAEEYIFSYKYQEKIRPGKVSLRDYNFIKPTMNLETVSKYKKNDNLEIYNYPGGYGTNETGSGFAKIYMEEWQVERQVSYGESTCRQLIPGYKFNMKEHSNKKYNTENLLLSVVHQGSQPELLREKAASSGKMLYKNEFKAISSDITFRPSRKTEKPIVNGNQTAIVVGPAKEEIYTDEHGRIKVQFHWDREGKKDEKSSCWIRVAQLWAGGGWGGLFIPRIGQEVVVSFLEGNPDRPLIVGCVYNGDNAPPYKLPDERVKSAIKSNSTPRGSDTPLYSGLLIDDSKGKSQVVLYNAYGHKITQDEEKQTLTVETDQENKVCLDDKNKNIFIKTTLAHELKLDDENKKISLRTKEGHHFELDDGNKKMLYQTKEGHKFEFDDENKKIELTTKEGHTTILDDQNKKLGIVTTDGHAFTMDDAGQSITLEDAGGEHKIKIDIGGSKIIVSTDSGAIDILAPNGKLTLDAAEIDIKSGGDFNISANNIKLDAAMKLEQKGGTDLIAEAGVNNKVKGGVMVEINGTMVKIN